MVVRLATWFVLSPATCALVKAPRVSAAKSLRLLVLKPLNCVDCNWLISVEPKLLNCAVVRAPTCAVFKALNCVLLKDVTLALPSETMSLVSKAATCFTVNACSVTVFMVVT